MFTTRISEIYCSSPQDRKWRQSRRRRCPGGGGADLALHLTSPLFFAVVIIFPLGMTLPELGRRRWWLLAMATSIPALSPPEVQFVKLDTTKSIRTVYIVLQQNSNIVNSVVIKIALIVNFYKFFRYSPSL